MYRQAILGAFVVVENSLSSIRNLGTEQEAITRAVASAQKAAELAKTRYESGTSPYLDVIEANRTLLLTQRVAARLAGQRLVASVSLIKALGGGWETSQPAPLPAAKPDPEAKSISPEPKKNVLTRMKGLFGKKD